MLQNAANSKFEERRKTLPPSDQYTRVDQNTPTEHQVGAEKKIRILLQKKHNRTTMNVNN